MVQKKNDDPPFSKDSPEGKLLDSVFRTAGVVVDGIPGLGLCDPYFYSAASIPVMPGMEILKKFGDDQFRKAADRAAGREIRRRMKAREVPEPNAPDFRGSAAAPPPRGAAAGAATGAGMYLVLFLSF